jgi:hypothetical protein
MPIIETRILKDDSPGIVAQKLAAKKFYEKVFAVRPRKNGNQRRANPLRNKYYFLYLFKDTVIYIK